MLSVWRSGAMAVTNLRRFKDVHLHFDERDHAKLKAKKEKERKKRGLMKLTWEDIVFMAIIRL